LPSGLGYFGVMLCVERDKLWNEYTASPSVFTACAEDLEKPFTASIFGLRLIAVRAAKDDCKRAREAWEQHLVTHLCDGEKSIPASDP
jgi:hypothetical protein